MHREIERKFLLKPGARVPLGPEEKQVQGYLPSKGGITVRVRLTHSPFYLPHEGAYLTVKGPTRGISRQEVETALPTSLGRELLKFCNRKVVKTRRRIRFKGHTWEVDFFGGPNRGLVVAEVELRSPKERVELPPWIGKEVTGTKKYSCSNLAKRPYRSW